MAASQEEAVSPEKLMDEVSDFYDNIEAIKTRLTDRSSKFAAGQIQHCLPQWQEITHEEEILKMVVGVDIQLLDEPPSGQIHQAHFSREQSQAIDVEIEELLRKGVIVPCNHTEGEFISPIFIRPKKDNRVRVILNLKKFNVNVENFHFKMETLKHALTLVSPNCFFCSLDLRDAYYSVPMTEKSQNFLKFEWKGQLYKYTAFPNGLACCPRLFTKLLKPVMAQLHRWGFISTIFIDDTLLMGDSELECVQNVKASLCLFEKLGFVIHPEKSVLAPTHVITYLGFEINSVDMTVTLMREKKEKIFNTAASLLTLSSCSIRFLAKFIGQIVASFPGVKYGPLWYRNMENDKIEGLKMSKGKFDANIQLSEMALAEISWWTENINSASNDIDAQSRHGEPDFIIFSDASLLGWGASCDLGQTGGHWLVTETGMSINALELKAGLFGLQSLLPRTCRHVRMMMDNTTAVACVNKMGTSHSKHCNMITKQIWDFCIEKGVWLSAAHVPGRENVDADLESRKINYDTEWKLNTELLQQAFHILGVNPDLDLFASRINTQLSSYVSFKPDPGAKAVDAFTLNWHDTRFYAFPPFCVIPKVLQKICRDRAKGVVVVPDWPNQPWFPLIAKMLINYPVLVSARKNLLSLPQSPAEEHRLQKLRLIICELSGVASDAQGFRNKLQTSCVHPGEPKPKRDMPAMWQSGAGMRTADTLIPYRRL